MSLFLCQYQTVLIMSKIKTHEKKTKKRIKNEYMLTTSLQVDKSLTKGMSHSTKAAKANTIAQTTAFISHSSGV